MSDFEEDPEVIDLCNKVLEIYNEFNDYEHKIYLYMCNYLTPYYEDASKKEQWQVTLDLAEAIQQLSKELYALTVDQLQMRRNAFIPVFTAADKNTCDEYIRRDNLICDVNKRPVEYEDALYVYLFSQLPILEPLNED